MYMLFIALKTQVFQVIVTRVTGCQLACTLKLAGCDEHFGDIAITHYQYSYQYVQRQRGSMKMADYDTYFVPQMKVYEIHHDTSL